ncbi:MAG: RelA/SpoT family protein [Desulfopila sp.]
MSYTSMLNPQGLKALARNYLHDVDLSRIDKAWEVVVRVHGGQLHWSGESYLLHLQEVASTLASMHLDLDTILAGMLHGVLREGIEIEDLRREFGPDVATIVAGSSKINNVQYNSKLVRHAESVRKMLLAIAADIRVLLVKLIDRLQDMVVLDKADRELQLDIARETMDLYAPLASRLGIDWLKRELEDYSFRYLYPEEYDDITSRLESSLTERQQYVDEVIAILQGKLEEADIRPLRILGRPKHIYSIYKKLLAQNIPLERVYDKVAFRIIVNTVKECYEALGTIHANWSPVPGRIKDFISVPKSNNYQSMHTTVIGPREHFIEIQIRTEEMDRVAQEGVAAHWAYKEGQKVSDRDARLFKELKKLVKSLQDVEDPREFLDSVKGELYDPDVYALTPAGDVKEFPTGSCPIDFAYAIHTQVGDRCVGAKVNGRIVQLKYQLQNGDIVEIVTSPTQTPRRGWLDLVKTSRARARIRQWLRRDEKEKALKLGREICEREIRQHDTTLKKMIKSGHIRLLLRLLRCNSLDDMLVKVGQGMITIQSLVRALQPPELAIEQDDKDTAETTPEKPATAVAQHPAADEDRDGISITGVEGMLVKISRCCNPLPGDPIIGFITQGRGVSIHKQDCVNLKSTDPHRWIDVSWTGLEDKHYRASIHIHCENYRGIFADIGSSITGDNANIADISGHTTPENTADVNVTIEVRDRRHLQVIMQHLRQMQHVISVRRV